MRSEGFKNLGALDLTIPVMQELIKRSRLDAGRIDDVIWDATRKHTGRIIWRGSCSESRTSGYSTGITVLKLYLLGVIGTVGILPDPGRRSRLYSGRRHRSDEVTPTQWKESAGKKIRNLKFGIPCGIRSRILALGRPWELRQKILPSGIR